ncbi:MAG: glycosyltransferase [Tissierellia bacterium]|nr:glycosyltransferase [Tissierellia bacterium]
MARIIFHVPNKLMENMKSASHIRPFKMIEAFKELGYDVDLVMGDVAERKAKIKEIKENIVNGVRYDFMYSESSTMPTLLTESHHLPLNPFLDFGFMKYIKSKGIKIGLFYRDIHWKFPLYKKNVKGIKYHLAILMYKYDLRKYEEILDILYLPNLKMKKYLPKSLDDYCKELPPGMEIIGQDNKEIKELRLIYVGGLGDLYNISEFVKAVNSTENIYLTICCRENEWEKNKNLYSPFLNERIKIVHLSGEDLKEEYKNSNIGVLTLKPSDYLDFAVPYKLYEYMGHSLPIISTDHTASADIVRNYDIGFVIDNFEKDYKELFEELKNSPQLLNDKKENIRKIQNENTWLARAKQVANELKEGE